MASAGSSTASRCTSRRGRSRRRGRMPSPRDFVDVERYPIDEPDSPRARALVGQIRDRMAQQVLCALPGFLRTEAVERMRREAEALEPLAYPGPTEASPYFFNYGTADLDTLAPDHPRRRKTPRR